MTVSDDTDENLCDQPHANDVNENYSGLRAYADINVALSRPIVNASIWKWEEVTVHTDLIQNKIIFILT